ncbi:acyltransferase family protein [Methylomonas montana]|uniref:acyltransferase family protein n=1 Tax=Methylomonas montana TaxID=3058963 RepID=UPI00265AB868|nr:acyltransferase family protein [Methylomonas montana]WKJ89206.1 acyltransferase family protein [Methylomonas montana]
MPKYFAHIDGLRAFAVLAVIIYHLHSSLLPGGFIGVDVFFVISGFVVTASLTNHKGESFTAFLGFFYARRLTRLAPALMAMLLATTLAYVLFVPRTWFNRGADDVGQAAFWGFSNWILDQTAINYFEPRAEFNPFTHTWSLGVEEQYYLIAPLLLFNWVRWRAHSQRRRLAIAVMILLAMVSFVACVYQAIHHGPRFVFYQITFRFWELAAGVVWYQWAAELGKKFETYHCYLQKGAWIGLVLIVGLLLLPNPQAYPWLRAWCAVIGCLLLIGDPYFDKDSLRRLLASSPMLWIGQRSYSLYLWHWPVFVMFRWTVGLDVWPFNVLALGLTLVLGAVSYRWVESPLRKNQRFKKIPAGWRIVGFLVFIGISWQSARLLLAHQPELGLGQPTINAKDWHGQYGLMKAVYQSARQCEPRVVERDLAQGRGSVIEYFPDACLDKDKAQLFVLGDSHATAYLPMFEQLSAEQGRTVRVLHSPGCPYIDLIKPMGQRGDPSCLQKSRATLQEILDLAKQGDIVFLPSLRLPRFVDFGNAEKTGLHDTFDGTSIYERSALELQSIAAAANDAPEWLSPFEKAGLHVLFEAPKPIFRAHPFRCVDFFNRFNPDCKNGFVEERANEETYRAPTLLAMTSLALNNLTISIWDPLPLLCEKNFCKAMQGERPLFFDADHVSPYGNVVLYPAFKQAIEQVSALPK